MKLFIKKAWLRFASGVPAAERKAQLILAAAAACFAGLAAINWPGKLALIATVSGYIAAACGGMTFLLQFAMQTQVIVQTETEVAITATQTTTATEVPANG